MKTFGELTREEKIELVTAWIDGKEIEVFIGREWCKELHIPAFTPYTPFRIKPTKPSINWDHVHPDYNYLVMGKTGACFISYEKPTLSGGYWCCGERYHIAKPFSSFKPGTCDWKESLVERPKK